MRDKRSRAHRSYKLELSNLPYTVFTVEAYVSVEDVDEVKSDHKKAATIWIRKPKERSLSCEAHKT